jgi:hypothetical protein
MISADLRSQPRVLAFASSVRSSARRRCHSLRDVVEDDRRARRRHEDDGMVVVEKQHRNPVAVWGATRRKGVAGRRDPSVAAKHELTRVDCHRTVDWDLRRRVSIRPRRWLRRIRRFRGGLRSRQNQRRSDLEAVGHDCPISWQQCQRGHVSAQKSRPFGTRCLPQLCVEVEHRYPDLGATRLLATWRGDRPGCLRGGLSPEAGHRRHRSEWGAEGRPREITVWSIRRPRLPGDDRAGICTRSGLRQGCPIADGVERLVDVDLAELCNWSPVERRRPTRQRGADTHD